MRRGAWLIILLFVLQSVFLAAASHARLSHAGADQGTIASAADRFCGIDANGNNGGPSHRRLHSECCILCASNSIGKLSLYAAPLYINIDLLWRDAQIGVTHHFRDNTDLRLAGWASTWTSRAPPASPKAV
jgi:hypothetical protein